MKFWATDKVVTVETKLSFKQQFSYEERLQKAKALKIKHTNENFLPAVVEGLNQFNQSHKPYMLMALDKTMTIIFVIQYLRRLMKLKKNQSIFIQANKKIVDMGTCVEEDGFIYLKIKTQDSY